MVRQMDGLHNTRNKMEEAIGILEVKNARLSNHKNELMRSASKLTECQNKITRQKQKIENAKRNQIGKFLVKLYSHQLNTLLRHFIVMDYCRLG